MQSRPREPKDLGNGHNKELGRTGDWVKNHRKWIAKWNRRGLSIEEGQPTGTYVMSDDYWEWFSEELTYGRLWLTPQYQGFEPADVYRPPRFPEPWQEEFEQLPPNLLWQIPPNPEQQEVEAHQQQEQVQVQDLDAFNQWVGWDEHLNQPPQEYVGWHRAGSPPPQEPEEDHFPPPDPPQWNLGFGADFQGRFLEQGQSSNAFHRSPYEFRQDPPPNERYDFVYTRRTRRRGRRQGGDGAEGSQAQQEDQEGDQYAMF
jgi:hypothetical protein